MILQALVKYYEELVQQGKAAKPGWCQAKVSHAIELNADGTIKTIISLKKEEQRGKKKVWVPEPLNVPEMVTRSSGIASNFLCDNAKYFLGIDAEGTNQRVIDCFHAAREKHLAILGEAEGEMAKAICLYFKNWNPEQAKKNPVIKEHWEELNEGGNIIFSMKGIYAQEDDEIKKLWDKLQVKENSGKKGICLVTGQKTEIARIHRGIKGVPGAQSSGAALVSFNAPSFESYGKEQSYNAPVGKYAEFAYTTALNYLLDQNKYRLQLGDTMIVYWAESGQEACQKAFSFVITPNHDNQREIQKVFDGLQKQKYIDSETDRRTKRRLKIYIVVTGGLVIGFLALILITGKWVFSVNEVTEKVQIRYDYIKYLLDVLYVVVSVVIVSFCFKGLNEDKIRASVRKKLEKEWKE